MARAMRGLGVSAQRAAAALQAIVRAAREAIEQVDRMLAPLRDPARPLIDRVRDALALLPDAHPFQVARLVGERRVLLVAVMMRMVTLAAERGRVAATEQDDDQHDYRAVGGGPEASASLPASRPVREDC